MSITSDFAVVSVSLHDVALVTLALEGAHRVDAQVIAHADRTVCTLVNIGALVNVHTGDSVLQQLEPCGAVTPLHKRGGKIKTA